MKINITRRHLEVFITESVAKTSTNRKEWYLYGDIFILVKDPLPAHIDLELCLQTVETKIPQHLVYGLDSIFIGEFPEFEARQINAFYRDGAIYITNEQDDDDDFADDLVHELAHLVEKTYGAEIYEDQKISREFLGKRQRLYYMLKSEGYDVQPGDFIQTEYVEDFDMFLFKEVGYEILRQLTQGLFVTPYGATSLAEYFAESFEHYFLKDRTEVKTLSPNCYNKLNLLVEMSDD
tara:strand:- start:542 stop:1249 length:708 start_codon:yes stop_codon:yes gene_type:complete